jgi:hypothetical protein
MKRFLSTLFLGAIAFGTVSCNSQADPGKILAYSHCDDIQGSTPDEKAVCRQMVAETAERHARPPQTPAMSVTHACLARFPQQPILRQECVQRGGVGYQESLRPVGDYPHDTSAPHYDAAAVLVRHCQLDAGISDVPGTKLTPASFASFTACIDRLMKAGYRADVKY